MSERRENMAVSGKTYSLYDGNAQTGQYYITIKKITDLFLERCPDEKRLLSQVQLASGYSSLFRKLAGRTVDRPLVSFMKKTLRDSLSMYTKNVEHHLRTLPRSLRTDTTLRTREEQYHLYMVEIELVNRMYQEEFKNSEYKFALIAHCLRDFRPDCRSKPGDIESICRGCTEECFIRLGSILLKKYNIHPYISVTMELKTLFKLLKVEHPSIGALGIACVPELVNGMRLCLKLRIPAVGIPLDANRCSRWMGECRESSFNMQELERLIQ
jgi:hypothetical protein